MALIGATRTDNTVAPGTVPSTRPRSRRRSWSGLAYVMPSLALATLVSIIPIIMTIGFSFTSYSVVQPGDFVGLDNYARLLKDPTFASAIRNTVIYTLISVPLQTVVALLLAELLAKVFRNRFGAVARSVLFIPVIASMVVVGTVWRVLLSDQGFVNSVLGFFGAKSVNFLGDPTLALISVSLITVWANVGYFLVIYYAGILEIPGELYEAAAIDGAGAISRFWHITVPSLRPVTALIVILGTIWSFQVFDLIYTMTGGGPGGATVTLVVAIYRAGFQNFQMGYASAMAVVLLLGVLVISILQNIILNRRQS